MAWLLKETEFNMFIGNGLTVTNTLRETRVSGVPGREGGGRYLRMHKQGGDESQSTKSGQLFSSRSCSYLCPTVDGTLKEDSKFSIAVTL